MKIFRDFDSVDEIVNPVVTLGSFDGIHSGHRQILNGVIAESKRIKGQSVVITFDPHPRQVIFPEQKMELLTTTEEKAELLERFGIDILLVVEFNETFRQLSSEDFVRNFLVGKLENGLTLGRKYCIVSNSSRDSGLYRLCFLHV